MFCISCNADIGIRFSKFCPHCGVPLQVAQTPTAPAPDMPIPDDDSTVLLPARKATPQESVETMPTPDVDSDVLIHEAAEMPQDSADTGPVPDNSPTVQLLAPMPIGSMLKSAPMPPLQPTTSTSTATSNTKHRKKKHKKARGRAKLFAQKPPIEPFIGTAQNEPVSPFNKPEPLFTGETFPTFPTASPEKNDRIVVEPPYPGPSPIPTQFVRESIHPGIFGLAAIILIVFLGGLVWWNASETESFPEDIDAPLQALTSESIPEPIPDTESSLTLSTPAPPVESLPAFDPEEQVLEQEAGSGLMNIPSLPTNQQQGRHNQYSPAEIKDEEPPSISSPLPMPAPPMPSPARKQTIAAPPELIEMPTPAETAPRGETASTPARAPVAANPRPATPPWLEQMRDDLSNCQSFFCRERVRRQYCTSQWEALPECRSASL